MRSFIAAAALAAIFITTPALAEEAVSNRAVRIETDQNAKAFVFIIDDKPVALLDKSGLTVREGIVYGATLTDAGTAHFDKQIESLNKEAADE